MSPAIWLRGRAAVRQRLRSHFGKTVVTRTVAGARLTMPWSHRLPDYVKAFPGYGRNLVDLVEELNAALPGSERPIRVVDLGANIGDSALQILARTDARVLCIDGDPYWIPFLHRNVDHDPRCTVEEALVVEQVDASAFVAVRSSGTTRFERAAAGVGTGQITAKELRLRHPSFDRIRLIKSDIDGFDCRIVPLLAAAWQDAEPVLFFEYDPAMSRAAGDDSPVAVWDRLEALGYHHVAVWDNLGQPLGHATLSEARAAAASLESNDPSAPAYWDVAVAVATDDTAGVAFEKLAPGRLAG